MTAPQHLKFLPQSRNQSIQRDIRIPNINSLHSTNILETLNESLHIPNYTYHGHSDLSKKLTKSLITNHLDEKHQIATCRLSKQLLPCVDSRAKQFLTNKNLKTLIRKLTKNFEVESLHILLYEISERLRKNQPIDPKLEQTLIKKLKMISLNSLDPSTVSTIEEIKRTNQLTVLKSSSQLKILEILAHRAGFGLTLFLLFQYMSNSNFQGVGLNVLHLWIMPIIGTTISQKILNLGQRWQSKAIKTLVPSIGRGLGNVFSIVGLAMGIRDRIRASDPIEKQMANLHIISNTLFIIVEVPHIMVETMMLRGIRTLPILRWSGPIGTVITGIVMIGTHLIGIHLQVEKLSEIMELTKREKLHTYLSLLLIGKIPHSIKTINRIQQIYRTYVTNVLERLPPRKTIAVTLNPWIIKKIRWIECNFKTERFRIGAWVYQTRDIAYKILMNTTDKGMMKITLDQPRSNISRFVPKSINNYKIVCGPEGEQAKIETTDNSNQEIIHGPCVPDTGKDNTIAASLVERIHLEQNENCRNMIVYKNTDTNVSQNLLIYALSDLSIELTNDRSIEVIFYGNNISIDDQSHSNGINHYYLNGQLKSCRIEKLGINYFHINGSYFNCRLTEASNNVAVIEGRFEDTENLNTIVGSGVSDFIIAKFANFVDGKGGNDTIVAGNSTIVRGYFGDSVRGTSILILPLLIHEIVAIVVRDRIIVYNELGESIDMDRNTTIITPDRYIILPSRINDDGIVEEVVVEKFITSDFLLDNELNELRGLTNSNFRMTKRATGRNYDIVLGHVIRNVFISGEDHRNYYWEADTLGCHFYIIRGNDINVTVSQGNGLLDFQGSINDIVITKGNFGELRLHNDRSSVTLLSNLKNLVVTFDGITYYKIVNDTLNRDHCYDGIPVEGRVFINVVDLTDRPRCFKFQGPRVTFFQSELDLFLISYKTILRLIDYYSHVVELAIEWGTGMITPQVFRGRAERPASLKFYQVDERGMMIYHNQPDDDNDIGLIDMKDWSVLNCFIEFRQTGLYLYHNNKTVVRVENWLTNPSGRRVMFYFEDALLYNAACVISNCEGDDILLEFEEEKLRVRGERTVTSGAETIFTGAWIFHNFQLALLLGARFFHIKYPLPRYRREVVGENLALGVNMIETLKSTAEEFEIFVEDLDFFEVYENVAEFVRNDEYDRVFEILYSIGERIGSGEFLDRLEFNLRIIHIKFYS